MCLAYCAEKKKLYSYGAMADYCYGKCFRIFVDLVFFLNNFGTLASYSILLQTNICQTFGFVRSLWWKEMPGF